MLENTRVIREKTAKKKRHVLKSEKNEKSFFSWDLNLFFEISIKNLVKYSLIKYIYEA